MEEETTTPVITTADTDLSRDEIHHVLSNERRRLVLASLDNGTELSVRELAGRIARVQTEMEQPPRQKRQSVYVSLLQLHLPKLDDLSIIEYDAREKTVKRGKRADDFTMCVAVPDHGITWNAFHIGVGVLGLLTAAGAAIGVPGLARLSPVVWCGLGIAIIVVTAGYQTIRRQRSIVYRAQAE